MNDALPSPRSSSAAWRRAGVLAATGLLAAAVLALRFSRAYGWLHGSLLGDGGAAPAAPGAAPGASVRYNYAAASCGAKVVWTKSLHGGGSGGGGGGGALVAHAPAVLDGGADRYLYAVCSHCGTQHTGAEPGCFWFVVELCQAIKVDAIALQTTELFAAYPKDFSVQGSFTAPPNAEWVTLGNFSARLLQEKQVFAVVPMWCRYVRFVVLSRWGTEDHCAVSAVAVYGNSLIEDLVSWDQRKMTLPQSTSSRTAPPHPPDVLHDLGPHPAPATPSPTSPAAEDEGDEDDHDAEPDAPEEGHAAATTPPCSSEDDSDGVCEWCGAQACTECRARRVPAFVRTCPGRGDAPHAARTAPRRTRSSSSSSSGGGGGGEPEVFPSLGLRLHHMEGVLETTRAYVEDVAEWAQDVTAQHGAALGRLGTHVGALEREHGRSAGRVKLLEDQLGELLADFTLQKRAYTELVVTVFLLSLLSSAAILTVALARVCCGAAPGAGAAGAAGAPVPLLASPLPLRAAHRRGRSTTPRPYSPSNF